MQTRNMQMVVDSERAAGAPPTTHDEHFLGRLDRVVRDHLELALCLYRDHEAVRQLLREQNVVAGGARIAIALADGGRGPHVIVAADGAFVTCLGEGMSPAPWRVISRATLDGLMRRVAERRRRRELVERFSRPGEDTAMLFGRLFRRKNMLSREELIAASGFASLLGNQMFQLCVETVADMQATKRKPLVAKGTRDSGLVEMHARRVWNAAYAIELCGLAGRDAIESTIELLPGVTTLSMPSAFLADHTIFLRGIWAAGKIGKPLIPSYRMRFETADRFVMILDAALGLTTIALRHSGTRSEIERIFHRILGRTPQSDADLFRVEAAARALTVMKNAESLLDISLFLGAEKYMEESHARLSVGDPDRFARAEDVPITHAKTALLMTHGWLLDGAQAETHLYSALPMLAKVSAEDFHYPSALTHKLLTPWGAREVTRHELQLATVRSRAEPVKYDARPTRNAPCPCGSGKKFKRCCST